MGSEYRSVVVLKNTGHWVLEENPKGTAEPVNFLLTSENSEEFEWKPIFWMVSAELIPTMLGELKTLDISSMSATTVPLALTLTWSVERIFPTLTPAQVKLDDVLIEY